MNQSYKILLEGKEIGNTSLEKADAPMGVVFGLINFKQIDSPFDFFKEFCTLNNITINTIDEQYSFIDTQVIPELKVFRHDGKEIVGIAGNTISGMKEEGYYITIIGIDSSLYEEEFPHHIQSYNQSFNK